MGILSNDTSPDFAAIAANRLTAEARSVWRYIVDNWTSTAHAFWCDPHGASPQDIADALGRSAVEAFELHRRLGELIASVDESALAAGLSVIGSVDYHEDGTVTVAPRPLQPPPQ